MRAVEISGARARVELGRELVDRVRADVAGAALDAVRGLRDRLRVAGRQPFLDRATVASAGFERHLQQLGDPLDVVLEGFFEPRDVEDALIRQRPPRSQTVR